MSQAILADPNGVPLGEDNAHPSGEDVSITFQVNGIDGVVGATGSDDTAATARQLGNVAATGLIQVSGAIGVDPHYDPSHQRTRPILTPQLKSGQPGRPVSL